MLFMPADIIFFIGSVIFTYIVLLKMWLLYLRLP